MKSTNSIIVPVLFLYIAYSTNAKSHFTSHTTEIHALHHNKALHPNKRDFLSCEQTWGEGSIPCGGSDSKYCYDPTIGETCCMQDYGYCGIGDVCASIAGYCCHKDENEKICMLRLGIRTPEDSTPDPDSHSNSDSDSEDAESGLTSVASSSSASQSQSQSTTDTKSDDESTDSDIGTESDDSDGASSPPISMLVNALNSGPLADEDADTEEEDPDSTLDSGSNANANVDIEIDANTGTNVHPESTAVVSSLETAVASATPVDMTTKDGISTVRAWETSTPVSPSVAVQISSSSATAVNVHNASESTSSALPSQSLSEGYNASATTSGEEGVFTGAAVRVGWESVLEGGMLRSWLVCGVAFVVWVVL
ncbi:uncharacterized protein EAF01_000259 [Botrytis porri]|uniref:uncharacterized protein n=1 Tax=Botrytis porri TaxID=87229 RepID=UPI0019017A3B|nr:uncharacterized protein EAF01_000259 [Botrytis porri]KAF7913853.1 hypothetical protein EAF01_000259 [Botrytis porri]